MKKNLTVTADRYHDVSFGHRVMGHENKCAHLHGHNYRFTFSVAPCEDAEQLDSIGRVMDFSVIKSKLCEWLERNWDHKFLVFMEDPFAYPLAKLDPAGVVEVPFNPTAENIGLYFIKAIAPGLLEGTGVELVECIVEETRKCSATIRLS